MYRCNNTHLPRATYGTRVKPNQRKRPSKKTVTSVPPTLKQTSPLKTMDQYSKGICFYWPSIQRRFHERLPAIRQRVLDIEKKVEKDWNKYPLPQIQQELDSLELPEKQKNDPTLQVKYMKHYAASHKDKRDMYGVFAGFSVLLGIVASPPIVIAVCGIFVLSSYYHGRRLNQVSTKLLALEHHNKKH